MVTICDLKHMAKKEISILPDERIESKIYYLRGKKVMIDRDLADLYGVETRILNQAVQRNRSRFPEDFMFRLTKQEIEILRSQIVILNGIDLHARFFAARFYRTRRSDVVERS